MSADQVDELKNNDRKFDIFNKMAHSSLHWDKYMSSDIIKVLGEVYLDNKLFDVKMKEAILIAIQGDFWGTKDLCEQLMNDTNPSGEQKAYMLNNLAMANFHIFHEKKREHDNKKKELHPSIIQLGDDVIPILKDAIRTNETLEKRSDEDLELIDVLLDKETHGPEEFYQKAGKDKFFSIIQNPNSGLPLTNICEHMLLQGPKFDKKHTSFWFVVGLKHHESKKSELLARHLSLLAIFYHAMDRTMIAEGLFTRALELTKDKKSFNHAFTLKMYSHVLSLKPNRGTEVEKLIKECKEIEDSLPEWMNKFVNFQIPE
jgi:hypothetical protein